MTKTLILVRHAKSDWTFNLPDFERPLNPRGLHDASLMAKRLHERAIAPLSLVSSPAKRALTTAYFFADELGIQKDQIKKDAEIYEADVYTLLKLINRFDDHLSHVVLVGHNPGISLLTSYLCHNFDAHFPTCAIAQLQFDTANWIEISEGTAQLNWFSYPKLA